MQYSSTVLLNSALTLKCEYLSGRRSRRVLSIPQKNRFMHFWNSRTVHWRLWFIGKTFKTGKDNSKNVGTLPLTVQKISQNKAANFKSWNWRCVCVYTLKCIFDFYNILKIDLLNIPDRNFFKIEFKKFLIKSLVVLTRNHPAHNQKNY